MQQTLEQMVSLDGTGLFTGEAVSISLYPAPVNTGIVFQRTDLPGAPLIPALLSSTRRSPRNTCLCQGDASIFMVEHLLSALAAYGVDNVRIEVRGGEVPAGDGSAQLFIDLLEKAGLKKQETPRSYLKVESPIYWSEGSVHLIALPADETRFSYTLHYPHSSILRTQYFSFLLERENYKKEIAPCRTFSLYEEILPFLEKGIIKGGGLENAVIIQGDRVLNPEGLRFPDEAVRHKVLDLMGDFALLGRRVLGHIIAICSGHASNIAFAKKIEGR